MSIILEARNISRSYGALKAVDQASLSLESAQVHALIGESGSGKTTLARILGGIEKSYQGDLVIPDGKRVVLVQQDFVIWPELTVVENVSIGCQTKADRKELVPKIIELMELGAKCSSKAGQLSYGQQQRVAIGRALAARADVLVLDEPFAHLDVWLRRTMWERCISVFKEMNVTSLWITHIVQDALPVADKVFAMVAGAIVQSGSPQSVYRRPETHQVAKITGPYNWLESKDLAALGLEFPEQSAGDCGCRPEQLELVEDSAGQFSGDVIGSYFLGPITLYHLPESFLGRALTVTALCGVDSKKRYRLELRGEIFPLT